MRKMSIWVIIILCIATVAFFGYRFIGGWLSWYGVSLPGLAPEEPKTIYDAVANSSIDDVNRLIGEGVDVNAPDYRGQAPLLLAVATYQFRIAEVLIDNGADIFAVDKLGFNVGLYASAFPPTTDPISGTVENDARERVIQKLKEGGFPWPPPWQDEVLQMKASGKWPPIK